MARHVALFDGTDAAGNEGLWVSNGTASGTFELTGGDIRPRNFTIFGNEVLFEGRDTAGFSLWVTDGTAARYA